MWDSLGCAFVRRSATTAHDYGHREPEVAGLSVGDDGRQRETEVLVHVEGQVRDASYSSLAEQVGSV